MPKRSHASILLPAGANGCDTSRFHWLRYSFWHRSTTSWTADPQSAARDEVRQAIDNQDAWLAHQSSGPGWNGYLLTAELKQELDKTGRADAATVQKILARYQSREPGLQLPRFAATRNALEAWADELQQPSDLPALVRAAKQNYQPIAKSDVLERQVAAEGAVHRLDNFLNRPGNHGAEWRAHLNLKDLQAQLAKGLEADPAALRKLSDNYFNGDCRAGTSALQRRRPLNSRLRRCFGRVSKHRRQSRLRKTARHARDHSRRRRGQAQ